MAVTISVDTNTSGYVEYPPGFLSFPDTLVESGDGLYEIPPDLVENGTGLYLIPVSENDSTYFQGSDTNISGYSVSEEATPLDPNSSLGAVGQFTVNINEAEGTSYLMQEVISLADNVNGKVQGTVRSITGNNGDVSVTADSILGLFNSDHIVPPFVGTLEQAFKYYCDLVGIVNDVAVDPTLASRSVVYPGFNGNMWVFIKSLCAKEQVEVSLVFNRVIMRPVRQFVANTDHDVSRSFSMDNQSTAKKVAINYYNHQYKVQGEVYPIVGEEPSIYQVDAGETMTFEIKLNASMMSVNQPACISFVENRPYPGTNGVYSVSGNDGLPITPAQWLGQGGSLTVEITEDPSVIKVTVVGASMTDYAPYRIAMTAGTSSYYNSLHITGTGVFWNRKTLTLVTGSTSSVTGEEVGATVDNPLISTVGDALRSGQYTARAFAGNHTVSGTAYGINRADADRSAIQFTVADFNAYYDPGTLVSEFNAEWDGLTVADFNAWAQARVDDLWVNQSFGNAGGARVKRGHAWFRINSATTSETGTQYTAVQDTLVGDFNPEWVGATVEDFNLYWAGKLVKDFNTTPLRRTE